MVVDMLSDKIYTTRSTNIEIGFAVILFLEQIVQLRETGLDFRDIVVNILQSNRIRKKYSNVYTYDSKERLTLYDSTLRKHKLKMGV